MTLTRRDLRSCILLNFERDPERGRAHLYDNFSPTHHIPLFIVWERGSGYGTVSATWRRERPQARLLTWATPTGLHSSDRPGFYAPGPS